MSTWVQDPAAGIDWLRFLHVVKVFSFTARFLSPASCCPRAHASSCNLIATVIAVGLARLMEMRRPSEPAPPSVRLPEPRSDLTCELATPPQSALAGISVLELSARGPAPFCGRMLADMGRGTDLYLADRRDLFALEREVPRRNKN